MVRRLPSLALTLALFWALFTLLIGRQLGYRSDFLAFYTSGYLVQQGQSAQLFDAARVAAVQEGWLGPMERHHRFVYLPLFAAAHLPLAALPLAVARLGWLALSLLWLAVALHIARRWSPLSRPQRWLAALAFPATYGPLLVGQNSALTLALWAAIAAALWQGRAAPLQGLLGGLLLYKPQLLLPLGVVWLVRRQWETVAVAAAVGGALLLGSLLLAPAATLFYLSAGRDLLAFTTSLGANAALYADLRALLPARAALAASGLLGTLALALLAWAWGRPRPSRYAHAMLWLAPLLVTPYVANYDLLLLLLPLSLLHPLLGQDRALRWTVGALWFALLFNLFSPLALSAWLTLLLFALCALREQQGTARPAAASLSPAQSPSPSPTP